MVKVDELDKLFRNEFGFKSRVVTLDTEKRPQAMLDNAITGFILENDGHHRSHLLIVYYTGHGYAKVVNGSEELIVAGYIAFVPLWIEC